MALQDIVHQTVTGLGLDLVEIERLGGGLLRITIDRPFVAGAPEQLVTVEDCETVTRQLQFALEVEQIEYRRLEVSSPGIDRLLRGTADLERFLHSVVDVSLKQPIGATAGKLVAATRKKFRGTLERGEVGQVGDVGKAGESSASPNWRLVWRDEPATKPGQRVSKKREPAPLQALDFVWDDVREVRLAPIVDFKGRRGAVEPSADAADALSDEAPPFERSSELNNG